MGDPQFLFEWDPRKGAANLSKHGVSFETARSVFTDPHIVTVGDLEHGNGEERWFSIGCAANGAILSVAYVWTETEMETSRIRIISARKATRSEIRQYREGL